LGKRVKSLLGVEGLRACWGVEGTGTLHTWLTLLLMLGERGGGLSLELRLSSFADMLPSLPRLLVADLRVRLGARCGVGGVCVEGEEVC